MIYVMYAYMLCINLKELYLSNYLHHFLEDRANGLEVEVGITLDSMVLISKIDTFTVLMKTIYPPAGTQARYVSTTLRTGQPLSLAEVEVLGKPGSWFFFLYKRNNFVTLVVKKIEANV